MMTLANTLAAAQHAADFAMPVGGHDRAWTTAAVVVERTVAPTTRIDDPSTGHLGLDAFGFTRANAWSPPT